VIATAGSLWLQKTLNSVSLQLFCVCHCKHSHGNFVIAKKRLNSVCLQLCCVCVIATRSYLCLQHDCVYVVKAIWLFGYLWLQAWVVCDCNCRFVVIANKSMHSVFENYFVCDCKHCWLFYDCKKKPEQCAFATILRVWLQPEVICACNMTVSMWLKLFGYLVIYDCKPK
jgi:hypothetical protein